MGGGIMKFSLITKPLSNGAILNTIFAFTKELNIMAQQRVNRNITPEQQLIFRHKFYQLKFQFFFTINFKSFNP